MAPPTAAQILAENVRREMAAREWSQGDLAERADMAQPRVAEILSAKFNPTLRTVDKLAKAFRTSVSALLSLTGDSSPPGLA